MRVCCFCSWSVDGSGFCGWWHKLETRAGGPHLQNKSVRFLAESCETATFLAR
ncbi:hypothetical protein HK096_004169, partial [Nowakowskiella sp. JEL0078]